MASRPVLDLRFLDRWLAGLLVVLSMGLAAGMGIGYAKKSRFSLCQGEAGVRLAGSDGEGRQPSSPLWLPAAEFESLGNTEGVSLVSFRARAGGSGRAVRLDKQQAHIDLVSDHASTLSVRPLRDAQQCGALAGELELIWPERSLLAWMVPALREVGG